MSLGLKLEREDSSTPPPEESWETLILKYSPTPQELERRKQAQQRLKEAYSSIPWYRERGERDGDLFWEHLHDSAILSDG